MDKYWTKQGDTWDSIALMVYGSEKKLHFLLEANPEHKDWVVFPANCDLSVPDLPVKQQASLLPWR